MMGTKSGTASIKIGKINKMSNYKGEIPIIKKWKEYSIWQDFSCQSVVYWLDRNGVHHRGFSELKEAKTYLENLQKG